MNNLYKLTFNVSTGVLQDFLVYREVFAKDLEEALIIGNETCDYLDYQSSEDVCFSHISTEQLDSLLERQSPLSTYYPE